MFRSFVSRGMKPIEFEGGCARNSKWKSVENGKGRISKRSVQNELGRNHAREPSCWASEHFFLLPLFYVGSIRLEILFRSYVPCPKNRSYIPWTDASISLKFSRDTLFPPRKLYRRKHRNWGTALNLWNCNGGSGSFYCIYFRLFRALMDWCVVFSFFHTYEVKQFNCWQFLFPWY